MDTPTPPSLPNEPLSEELRPALPIEREAPPEARPLLLLPAPRSLQYLSGAAALILLFCTSASLTVAYLSGKQSASAASQAAAAGQSTPTLSILAESAYVLDLTNNRILYEKNPDVQLPLASLVKVPLVLAVSEVIGPEDEILIPPHTTPDGAGIRIPPGLRFSARDLMSFTLVASSNEGADLLAASANDAIRARYHEAQGDSSVVWRMSAIVKGLGLDHLLFLNTNGLDLSETQAGAYGSAHDVAHLFAYAASSSPALFEHTARTSITIKARSGETVTGVNTDDALPAIPGIIMGKTGYTALAGGNLAVVFEVGPSHPVVAVVLHSTQDGRFADMKTLITATQAMIAKGR